MDNAISNLILRSLKSGQIRFKKHALIRIVERNIKIYEVEEALTNHKIISEYPEDHSLKKLSFTRFYRK